MILDVELAHRMMRRLDVNFSIVRRRADWASRDMPSASLMMTTGGAGGGQLGVYARVEGEEDAPLKRLRALRSTCCVWAMSLSTSWTTERSKLPRSLRVAEVRQLSPPVTGAVMDAPGCELDVVVGLDDVDVELAL